MTAGELTTRVMQAIRSVPAAARVYQAGDDDKLRLAISDSVRAWSVESLTLFRPSTALTLVVNQVLYDMRGAAVAEPMAVLRDVYIDKIPLLDFRGQAGPVSMEVLATAEPYWREASASRPCRWMENEPGHLWLWPKPDQVYADCFVSGWAVHPVLSADDTAVQVVIENEEALVTYCAGHLLARDRLFEAGAGLMDAGRRAAFDLRAKAQARHSIGQSRGQGSFTRGVILGRR